jgi:ATP-dependent Clp protease adaptor protein ClpS
LYNGCISEDIVVHIGLMSRRMDDSGDSDDLVTSILIEVKEQIKHPHLYRVLLLNDDYTPMDFVVSILKTCFNKTEEEATRVMLLVHNHGIAECGIYTYEVAETKVVQVMESARKHQHPLQCVMEKK